jgi:threonine/homoserine/homoserine lactone efflux protein
VLQNLPAFVALSAVVICVPGPDTALIIRNTLAGGRRSGIASAVGIICGIAVWTLAAAVGLAAVLSASEPLFRGLQLLGAVYLVFLGIQSLVAAISPRGVGSPSRTGKPDLTPERAFCQGLLSNLGNPKIAVFFVSLLPQFVTPGGEPALALILLGVVFSAMGLAWLTLYAVVVARAGDLLRGRARRAIDAIAGAVLVLFGLRLATER